MALDRIRPLKLEDPASGGTELDQFPTEVEPHEDYADLRGVTLQNDTSNDEDVVLSRDADNNMTFQDGVVSGVKTLNELSEVGHQCCVDNGNTLAIPQGRQFDHLGQFCVDGRKVIDGRFVLGIGANHG